MYNMSRGIGIWKPYDVFPLLIVNSHHISSSPFFTYLLDVNNIDEVNKS